VHAVRRSRTANATPAKGKRLGASNFANVAFGSYPPVLVSCGFAGHALACRPCHADVQVQAFHAEAGEEITHLVWTVNKDVANEEEMEESWTDVCVLDLHPPPPLQPRTRLASIRCL
jgi:hypothetical protein